MQQTATANLAMVVDRTYPVTNPSALYSRVETLLSDHGFAVQQTEPPLAGMASAEFRGGLRGERDAVLDLRRRKIGKALVIGGAVMTVLTLWVMVTGERPYWVYDWLLTIEVLMGGFGLMQLRNPEDRRRTVVEIALTGEPDGLRVAVQEGVGKVEGDAIFDWFDDEPDGLNADEIEALIQGTARDEATA